MGVIMVYKPLYDIPSGYLTQPWYRWRIDIDGLPNLKMLNNQMVYITETSNQKPWCFFAVGILEVY